MQVHRGELAKKIVKSFTKNPNIQKVVVDFFIGIAYNGYSKREVRKMSKEAMWRYYRELSAAEGYIIGFVVDGKVYMVNHECFSEYITYEKASRGQGMALRLRLRKAGKSKLLQIAICIGLVEELTTAGYNKGENFERLVHRYYKQDWTKDCKPFTECGDIRVNGKEIQIKFDGATFTNEKTLTKMMARVFCYMLKPLYLCTISSEKSEIIC